MEQAVFQHRNDLLETKHCWVCFANEDDDYAAQWVSPCKCRGTAKWVHKACLQRWIDEKQQGNSSVEVSCPQCNSIYIILYPKSGILVNALDMIDRIICKSCPFLAGGILVGSVYWTAVTYGAVTIMQVLGHKEGLNVMEKADPLIMLIGLPAIPVMLMLGRLIRWEDAVLKFWRKHSTKLPLLNLIFPNSSSQYLPRTPAVAYSSNSDPVSFTRTICGGLILPTIATIVGKLLFQRVNSNFQRSIIGGIAFVGLKGIFKIYYKQQQFLRQAHRQIKNYESSLSHLSGGLGAATTVGGGSGVAPPTIAAAVGAAAPNVLTGGQANRTTNSTTQTTLANNSSNGNLIVPCNRTINTGSHTSSIITATVNNQQQQQADSQIRQTSVIDEMVDSSNAKIARERLYAGEFALASTSTSPPPASVIPSSSSSAAETKATSSSNVSRRLTYEEPTSTLNDYLLYESNLNHNRRDDNATNEQAATQSLVSNFSNNNEDEI